MAASVDRTSALRSSARPWLLALGAIPLSIAGLSWWFTEPLADRGAPVSPEVETPVATLVSRDSSESEPQPDPRAERFPVWPDERTEGMPAKKLLLETLLAVDARLEAIDGYTAIFRKQERLKGALGAEQTIQIKVRHKPFAVYMKFVQPSPGREVVYAEGHHENKVIAHASGGVARFLVPRLAVPPDHPLALAENRHPITEAGLLNLTHKLVNYRRLDLDDDEAVTILDRTTDDDGRPWLRSVHTHPHRHPDRPFARVEVLYDTETRIPVRITSYDWPEPGQDGELLLAERYAYDQLDLEADLTALDFDPANPEYAFHR